MESITDNQKRMPEFTIILFYKYVRIDDPKAEMTRQRTLCESLGLHGRMIIAEEGINATLEGTTENIESYITHMKSDVRFADVHWKKSIGTGDAFPKLKIKARLEIVSLHLENDINVSQNPAPRLTPEDLKQWYAEGRQFTIVDMRNDYEYKVGRFKDSIHPGLKNFRDLKEKISTLASLKEDVIIPVCTGGIRCEKASAFLVREGFKNVYQLDGGMVSYMEKFPAQEFEGTLYTFDNRIVMDFDPKEKHMVVGQCDFCAEKTETFYNCAYPQCNLKVLCCGECLEAKNKEVFCSEECDSEYALNPNIKVQMSNQ
jgi:UPF0176 protein